MAGAGYVLIHKSIKGFGNYRCRRAGEVAAIHNDGLGQHHFLAKGMRETLLQNIESVRLDSDGKPEDTGWCQISRRWNGFALMDMPAVKAGTWAPRISGKTPWDQGYCPRYEEALLFMDNRNQQIRKQALSDGVVQLVVPRFVIAAHNAGYFGALKGYREGDVDKYTAGQDYSEWVFATATRVKRWLALHPGWKP